MNTFTKVEELNLLPKDNAKVTRIFTMIMLPVMVFYMSSMNVLLGGLMTAKAAETPVVDTAVTADAQAVADAQAAAAKVAADAVAQAIVDQAVADQAAADAAAKVVADQVAADAAAKVAADQAAADAATAKVAADVQAAADAEVSEPVVVETWGATVGNKATTNGLVEKDVKYVAPQNDQVTVTFTNLPENPGKLSIEEITLTPEQIASLGALSNKAYDITSDMADGSFTFDLNLPKPANQENVEIKFSETKTGLLENADTVATSDTTIETASVSASLDHFTFFVVSSPVVASGVCIAAGASSSSDCFLTIEEAIAAAVDGNNDTIYLKSNIVLANPLIISNSITIDGTGSKFKISGKPITIADGTVTLKNLILTGTENVQPESNYGIMVQGGSLTADNISMTVATNNLKGNNGFNVGSGASLDLKNSTIIVSDAGGDQQQYAVYSNGAAAITLNNNTFSFNAINSTGSYSYLIGMEGALVAANYPTITLTGTNTSNAYTKLLLVGADTLAHKQAYALPYTVAGERLGVIGDVSGFYLRTANSFAVKTEAELLAAVADADQATITLGANITLTSTLIVGRTVTIDGADYTLTRIANNVADIESYAIMVSAGTLTASNLGIVSTNTGSYAQNPSAVGITVQTGAGLNLSGSTITAEAVAGLVYGVYAQGANAITLSSNTFTFSGADTTNYAHRIMLGVEGVASTLSLTSNTIDSNLAHATQQEVKLMVNAEGSTLAAIKTYAETGNKVAVGEKLRATASDATRAIYTRTTTGWTTPVTTEEELLAALAGSSDIVLGANITLTLPLSISRTVTIDGVSGTKFTLSGDTITTSSAVTLKNLTLIDTENYQVDDGNYGIWVDSGTLTADNISLTVATNAASTADNDGFNVASGASLDLKNSTITLTGDTKNQHGVYAQSGAVAITLTNNTFVFPARSSSPYSYLISTEGATVVADYPTITLTGTNTQNAYIKLLLVGDDTLANRERYAAAGNKVEIGERLGVLGIASDAIDGIYVRPATGWNTPVAATAIAGVTPPVLGATPVTTVTGGEYTGTVAWSPNDSTFGPNRTYTATITLTATDGYSLVGVTENQFTIASSTSDTNPASSGVITAVFPATAKTQLTIDAPTLTLSKTYDGNTSAIVTAGTLAGKFGSDTVSIGTAVATYDTLEVGTGKNITVAYTLTGADASNYLTPANYTVGTGIIAKADGPAAPAAPTPTNQGTTAITLAPNSLYEFNINGGAWQDSNLFGGLSDDTSYTFTARVKETVTTNASPASAGTVIKTDNKKSSSNSKSHSSKKHKKTSQKTVVKKIAEFAIHNNARDTASYRKVAAIKKANPAQFRNLQNIFNKYNKAGGKLKVQPNAQTLAAINMFRGYNGYSTYLKYVGKLKK